MPARPKVSEPRRDEIMTVAKKVFASNGFDAEIYEAGFDTVDYSYSTAGVNVSLDNAANDGPAGEGDMTAPRAGDVALTIDLFEPPSHVRGERSIPFGSRGDPCCSRKCLPFKVLPASRLVVRT